MSKILGVDLGTTNSAFAIVEGGEPKVLENSEGARTTPSVVALSKTGERLVGTPAKRQAVTNPQNTLYGIKRFIGHHYDDEAVQKDVKNAPYEVRKAESGEGIEVQMGEEWYRPEQISSMLLQKFKEDAESKTGETITEAVITVPAYFNDSQRKATSDAGKIAGLEVKRIINEPTAAALAYGLDKKKDKKIAVYDFGGGTFDISILEVGDDVIEVKATGGDSHMGGKDIDQKIIDWTAEEYMKDAGIDVRKDPLALQRLDEAAEKAKHELSNTQETEINIPFITSDAEGPKHLLMKMTRATLEELAKEYIDRSVDITKQVVEDSGFKVDDIDDVILVGGQTRMPAVEEAVKNFFNKEPDKSINPDEVVAIGAAAQAGIIQGDVKDVLLLDVVPLSLGIETMGGVATKLIEKNTTIPTSKSQTFTTAADNQTSVEVHVVQGEREMAADNKSLGRFILDGIPPAPRGTPQIDVTFDIDANGILNVKAIERSSGKEQSIRIEASSGLSDEEVEKMTKEAEQHAEEDKKKKELVEQRNIADQVIYTAENSLKENEQSISEDVKNSVQEKITNLRNVKDGEDVDAIKNAINELSSEMQKIGQEAAQQASGQEGGQETAQEGGASEEGNVRDTEYEEKGDESSDNEKNDDEEQQQ